MRTLGIDLSPQARLNIAPGAKGQIVYETNQGRTLDDAFWSLLKELKPDGSGHRPSPIYSTFNARSGSLGTSPLWKTVSLPAGYYSSQWLPRMDWRERA